MTEKTVSRAVEEKEAALWSDYTCAKSKALELLFRYLELGLAPGVTIEKGEVECLVECLIDAAAAQVKLDMIKEVTRGG